MGIRDERNGNPLIVLRSGTRARVPNIFSTSNGAFSATTSLDSVPSSYTLNFDLRHIHDRADGPSVVPSPQNFAKQFMLT